METKYCSSCKKDIPRSEFNKRGDGLQPLCRECNRLRSRRYYAENTEQHRQVIAKRNKRLRAEIRAFIRDYKISRGCKHCGYNRCADALEAHHVHGDKEFLIGRARDKSLKRVQTELEKCEILCANCHREEHAKAR